jgi:hypothetical protein
MMTDSIPAVLNRLARSGVSVRWHDGRAVFSAAAEPPADVVALIDARKAEISEFLRPDAVQRRLYAEADLPRPPDVSDGAWRTATVGLRAFLAAGYGDEALRLDWSRDELFAVPPVWSRVDLCGAALLIGDCAVTEVTPAEIQIKTASGAIQTFRRKPTPDLALVYRTHCEILRRDFKHEDAEPLAYDRAVAFNQGHYGSDLATAKVAAMTAMKETKP